MTGSSYQFGLVADALYLRRSDGVVEMCDDNTAELAAETPEEILAAAREWIAAVCEDLPREDIDGTQIPSEAEDAIAELPGAGRIGAWLDETD